MDAQQVIQAFLKRHPEYLEAWSAWGKCYHASFQLRRFLRKHGIKAHLLWCQNCRVSFPRLCLATLNLCPDRDLWTHYVVCVEDRYVLDPTAKQFDDKGPAVREMQLWELQNEWLYYRKSGN